MDRLMWQEAWRRICRENSFTRNGLEALAIACETDSPRIDLCLPSGVFPSRGARIEREDGQPQFTNDLLTAERFDPMAFVAMEGKDVTVAQAHMAYLVCFRRLGGDIISPWFEWSEVTPREVVLRELAAECRAMLAEGWS
jgi:hypothetical protein